MAVASSGALESAPTGTTELSVCRAWMLWGGATDLLSSGQEHPCCPGPSWPACPGGRPDPGLCPSDLLDSKNLVPKTCAVGFALPPCSPSADPPPEPL